MKNFTRIIVAIFGSMLLFVQHAVAEVKVASDIYGNYVFTAKIELTDAGKTLGLADVLKAESDVTISKGEYFVVEIGGILGSSEKQLGNDINMTANTIHVNNPNGNGWLIPDKQLCMTGEDGEYLSSEFTYTFNPTTGVISLPDFQLLQVTIDDFMSNGAGTLVAKVTDARLTPEGNGNVDPDAFANLSGDWRFVPDPENEWSTMADSELPSTFNLTLASANDKNSKYTGTLSIEGIAEPVVLEGDFDGKNLVFTSGYAVFGSTTYYLADINDPNSTDIAINLQVVNDNTLEVKNGFYVCNMGKPVQYFFTGTLTNAADIETYDFTGEYTVTVGRTQMFYIDDCDYPKAGETFTFTIEEKSGQLFVTNWMGIDTWTYSSGTATAKATGNRLEIATGKQYQVVGFSDDYTELYIHVLGNGTGGYDPLDAPVTVTVNADGTMSIEDFLIVQVSRKYTDDNYTEYEDTPNYSKVNWYCGCTITKGGDNAITDACAEQQTNTIYNISGQQVKRPANGLYIINGKKMVIR